MVDMQSALQVTSNDPTGGKESGIAISKSQALFKGCRGCCEWVAFKVSRSWKSTVAFISVSEFKFHFR